MLTPFSNNFKSLTFDITDTIIQDGYVPLIKIPDLSTVSVSLDYCNEILSDAYVVLVVTEDNSYIYPDIEIGSWILSWITYTSSSSSSSSTSLSFELKDLIESGNYTAINIKYISTT
jgi:hypothetical protein